MYPVCGEKALTCVFVFPDGANLREAQPSKWASPLQRVSCWVLPPSFSTYLWFLCFQALWIRGAETRKHDGQREPHLRRARPGPARQRHRQLCLQDNRLAGPMRSGLSPPNPPTGPDPLKPLVASSFPFFFSCSVTLKTYGGRWTGCRTERRKWRMVGSFVDGGMGGNLPSREGGNSRGNECVANFYVFFFLRRKGSLVKVDCFLFLTAQPKI